MLPKYRRGRVKNYQLQSSHLSKSKITYLLTPQSREGLKKPDHDLLKYNRTERAITYTLTEVWVF